MTSFQIERVAFDRDAVAVWSEVDGTHKNWPVVYALEGPGHVYVGETTQPANRFRQHLTRSDRDLLTQVRVIIDSTFNKSACLDLEAFLIRRFAADGKYIVQNSNAGLSESDYFQRATYRAQFDEIFDRLRAEGLFDQTSLEIENSDLFKYSPFKSLTTDQTAAVLEMLTVIFDGRERERSTLSVVEGAPGTGKTIVAIFVLKVLADIKAGVQPVDPDGDSLFSDFYTEANSRKLATFNAAIVIPQQSLRRTVEKVFARTPRLTRSMVLSPYAVGNAATTFDLLIVDEAHRLQQLSATMPALIRKFKDINMRRYGSIDAADQLRWMRDGSQHAIFMLDTDQTVRPADIPSARFDELRREAADSGNLFRLRTQMRVRAGEDYTAYVRRVLSDDPGEPQSFAEYDLRFFDDAGDLRDAIRQRDAEFGLARLVAGYAWKWVSQKNPEAHDIHLDGHAFRWNGTPTDWINSTTSLDEVGSIHTVQGYDLNYAGVIIGPDLRLDSSGRIVVDRSAYFDSKGKANNAMLGLTYGDDDLLRYIRNIYSVLLTRGIRGTYVYVCDVALREHLRRYFSTSRTRPDIHWQADSADLSIAPASTTEEERSRTNS